MTDSQDHLLLLSLAKDAFKAERDPMWKIDIELASERFGTRCDRVWAELKRQLAARGDIYLPDIAPPIADQVLGLRREMKERLMEALPELIEQAIGEM